MSSSEAQQGARLLLVEDDPVLGEATAMHLERHGWSVLWHQDGLEAWEAFVAAEPPVDLVLSDVMLPGIDGVTLCRRVRGSGDTPVVLISARTDAIDVVGGLEAGADDYVSKPFDVQVLLARLRSVVRRAQPARSRPAPQDPTDVRRFGRLEVDRHRVQVRLDGRPVGLTPTEMRLLLALVDERGRVVAPRRLLVEVWEHEDWEDDDTHLVTVAVQRLRSKIGSGHVETVRGFGYRFVAEP